MKGDLARFGAKVMSMSTSVDTTELSFKALVSPFTVDEFRSLFREKQFLHLRQESRERLGHLLPWEGVRELLAQNLLDRKRLRIARGGRDIPPHFYRRDSDRNPVDTDKLRELIAQDASVVINRVQDLSPPVRRMARQMEIELGHKVNVNAYLTFGLGGAFAMHYDTHDVLVLQVHGSKRWFIYDQQEDSPVLEQKDLSKKPAPRNVVHDFELMPGDAIYVPRGFYHRAEVTGDYSVHLTFGIHTVRGIDYFDFLRHRVLNDQVFREDLETVCGPDLFEQQDRRIKNRLIELIEESSLSDFTDKLLARRRRLDSLWLGPSPEIDDTTRLATLSRKRDTDALRSWKGATEDDIAVGQAVLEALSTESWLPVAELREMLAETSTTLPSVLSRLIRDGFLEVVR